MSQRQASLSIQCNITRTILRNEIRRVHTHEKGLSAAAAAGRFTVRQDILKVCTHPGLLEGVQSLHDTVFRQYRVAAGSRVAV